jgi:predicted amidohydrolase YtcJ
LDSGGHLAFGSTWPRFALNPWETIQSVVIGGTGANGPERRDDLLHLTVAQAVEAYTIGAAFAGRREKMEGSIEVGKLADLIIVSKNIFDVNAHNISQTKVLTTIVGGNVVYQATNQPIVKPN